MDQKGDQGVGTFNASQFSSIFEKMDFFTPFWVGVKGPLYYF